MNKGNEGWERLGITTSVVLNYRAIQGLKIPWENGYRDVILEMDSKVVVDLLEKESDHVNYCRALIRMGKSLINRDLRI